MWLWLFLFCLTQLCYSFHVEFKHSLNVHDCAHRESANCQIAHISIGRHDLPTALDNIVNISDHGGGSVHKLSIEFVNMLHENAEALVDQFLMTYNWWILRHEVYDYDNNQLHKVGLIRYQSLYEPILRSISARQYIPSQEICDKTPLIIVRNIGSGWGSQSDLWQHVLRLPYAVGNVWYSRENSVDEELNLCLAQDCAPGLVNKWECTFLPLTNCSFSEVIFTKCHFVSSAPSQCFNDDIFKLSSMNSSDLIRTNSHVPGLWDHTGQSAVTAYQVQMDERFQNTVQNILSTAVMDNRPFLTARHQHIRFKHAEVSRTLTNFGLVFRPNAMLRRRIGYRIRELESAGLVRPGLVGGLSGAKSDPALKGPTCAAIHIRRGDRLRHFDIDMRTFCSRYTDGFRIQGYNCTDEALFEMRRRFPMADGLLNDLSCPLLSNFGCWSFNPFGSLGLIDYLRTADRIMSFGGTGARKHAFVMTDDSAWLENEITNLASIGLGYEQWDIGRLPIASNARSDLNGTRYTVDFWTSIAIARHCNAFVGHFGSSVSRFVFDAMCFQHGHGSVTGDCPIGADLGGDIN